MRVTETREVTETRRVQVSATCDRCKRALTPVKVFRDEPASEDTYGMYVDAALLVVEGWYGGFIDPMGRGPGIDLCGTCCRDLIEFLNMTEDEFFEKCDPRG